MYSLVKNGDFVCSLCKVHQIQHQELPAMNRFVLVIKERLEWLKENIHIHMGVSKNNGTPKSSILMGFSIINHLFWGTPIHLVEI